MVKSDRKKRAQLRAIQFLVNQPGAAVPIPTVARALGVSEAVVRFGLGSEIVYGHTKRKMAYGARTRCVKIDLSKLVEVVGNGLVKPEVLTMIAALQTDKVLRTDDRWSRAAEWWLNGPVGKPVDWDQ